MAAVIAVANTAEIALSGATAKTVLQLVAASNHCVKIKSWGVFFDGTSVTAEPVQVRLLRQTDAGTMSALTPVERSVAGVTLQTTAQHTAHGRTDRRKCPGGSRSAPAIGISGDLSGRG